MKKKMKVNKKLQVQSYQCFARFSFDTDKWSFMTIELIIKFLITQSFLY